MFFWRGSDSGKQQNSLTPTQKLQAYHDLAKEAGLRAIEADEQQRHADALKLYSKALEIMGEALAMTHQVPSSGLSAKADNVASWRADLKAWQEGIKDRLQQLQASTGGSRSCTAPPDARNILPEQRLLPQPAAAAAAATAAAAGKARSSSTRQQPAGAAQAGRSRGMRASAAAAIASAAAPVAAAGGAIAGKAAASKEEERLRQLIMSEVLERRPTVSFDDIAGLALAKQSLREAVILPTLRADIFSGLRAPVRGILLYGPPGNGKTLLAKALAAESQATFFNISAASLTSKWVGEGEKMVRMLFSLAVELQPSIIFMDEIDALLSARSSGEHDAARRLKAEFLVQFDGVAGAGATDARVIVIGATNRPAELDDAVRRRLVKRIYIPLPDPQGRAAILTHLLQGSTSSSTRSNNTSTGGSSTSTSSVRLHSLSKGDLNKVVAATDGYSASDLTALCKEAALGPVRELGAAITSVSVDKIRPVSLKDFDAAMQVIRPSADRQQLKGLEEFTREFGAA